MTFFLFCVFEFRGLLEERELWLSLVKNGRTAGLQVREGMQWNSGAGKAALKRVEQLGLFDKVNIGLAASDSDCGDREPGIALHLRLKESPQQSADVNTEWSFLLTTLADPTWYANLLRTGTIVEYKFLVSSLLILFFR